MSMQQLLPHAEKIAELLKARKETIAVAESSAGGLITAALLAVPGASAYVAGGAVVYNRNALMKLLQARGKRPRAVQGGEAPRAPPAPGPPGARVRGLGFGGEGSPPARRPAGGLGGGRAGASGGGAPLFPKRAEPKGAKRPPHVCVWARRAFN